MPQERRLHLLVAAIAIAVLYGSTYQQFRFFDVARPGGATDAGDYLAMARGEPGPDADYIAYRWLTPLAAGTLASAAFGFTGERDLALRLGFYVLNFAFSATAALLLFRLLLALRFAPLTAIIGMCAFASSRITVLVTGTPLVDAAYFCAIVAILYLTVTRSQWLFWLLPVFVLSKETILPFMLLPLLTELRRSARLWMALALSFALFAFTNYLVSTTHHIAALPVFTPATMHLPNVLPNLKRLATLAGLHDLQNGFSLWLALAAIGVWSEPRPRRTVPAVVIATVPIALTLALLSGNIGRMFFACFPAVIAYALIPLESVTRLRPASSIPLR